MQVIQQDEYLANISQMHIYNCTQNCATHLNTYGINNSDISSDNQHIPLTSYQSNKSIKTNNTAKIYTPDTAVKNFNSTSLGGNIMENQINKSLLEDDESQYISNDNQKYYDTITSSISTDFLNNSNQPKVTTLERQVLSFNNQSSTTVTPSLSSTPNNPSYTLSQFQNENFFIDNSTFGGISSMNVVKYDLFNLK